MFDEKEVLDLLSEVDEIESDRLKYIKKKIEKYTPLRISLSELNYMYYRRNGNLVYYNIHNLKELLHEKGIGYTTIIKTLGIPKATLSKLLTADRNVRLEYLNNFIDELNKCFKLNITKDLLKGN